MNISVSVSNPANSSEFELILMNIFVASAFGKVSRENPDKEPNSFMS